MKILVTGAAGFIGSHLIRKLLENEHEVVGIDNINDYYDTDLKYSRLFDLGISRKEASVFYKQSESNNKYSFSFTRMNLEDKKEMGSLFENENFEVVCNLAAQAGVRYSIENPDVYIQSNIVGFLNILECCRDYKIKHLVYASSSSVYGMNKKIPFNTNDTVDSPVSLYAATKKSNELMAFTYSHLYNIPTTGLRFFTVYGPFGRPDMAPMLFTKAILKKEKIKVFNHGDMERDFTYIDDIVEGITRIVDKPVVAREKYKLYNIGNSKSVKLLDFITALEDNLGIKAVKEMMPMQAGDVKKTWANIDDLIKDYNYKPKVVITEGVRLFVAWYKKYYS
ncbi:NAD-dependent epimerase/dehydratase family protein [Tenacibaculum retecalamus]|uniref:NAD-dependent epimerase/dehydratase family protein n=1 Tax=Tenacibaculum retecalamus TaxID=3018315 RepID=UPI0023D9009F|nr:NAD-dependent epimerase/dehydratase family protein [Tenacibaculum retecalamus]WBX70743.1 NAD-dependent epimerase/dehydratase family protein [Tenacibaculum retecalamus]